MQTRTWPYGTQRQVLVRKWMQTAQTDVLVCEDLHAHPREAYILIQARGQLPPSIPAETTIEFTQGGPTGGFWRLINGG